MAQYEATTGRRPQIRYADIVRAEAPQARERYYSQLGLNMQKEALDQNAEQFNQNLELLKDQADAQEDQAMTSNIISGVGLGMEAYPYAKKGVTAGADLVSGLISPSTAGGTDAASSLTGVGADIAAAEGFTPAAGTVKPAIGASSTILAEGATTPSTLAGAGADVAATELALTESGGLGTGVGSGSGVTSGAGSWMTAAGYVAAAIALQEMLAGDTDTVYEGQPTGSVFSMNEDGNWRPRFGNDPWKGWVNDKLGFEPTAGEKWDAAVANEDWGKALQRTPAAISQWLDPIGDLGSDVVTGLVDKAGGPEWVSDAVNAVTNPIGFVSDKISDSYICGATDSAVGMDKNDLRLLNDMYKMALEKRPALGMFYKENGKQLVRVMSNAENDQLKFYETIKEEMLIPVLKLLRDGLFDDGLDLYIQKTINLFKKYAPELHKQIPVEG